MRNKKLFLSAVIITTSMLLFTGCGNKAVTVSAEPAEPAEIISEVDAEESVESSESMETVLDSTDEATVEPQEEAQNLVEEQPVEEDPTDEDFADTSGIDVEATADEDSAVYSVEADYEIEPIEPMSLWAATNCNLRSGPGTQYDIVGGLIYAQEIIVDGRVDMDGKQWFVIQSDTEEKQMVSGSLVVYARPQPQVQQPTTSTDTADNTGSTESSSDTSQSQQSQQLDILPDSDTTSSNGPEIGDIIGYTDTGNPVIWGGTWEF